MSNPKIRFTKKNEIDVSGTFSVLSGPNSDIIEPSPKQGRKNKLFTALFWKDALERAISTAAQAFLAVVGAGVFNVLTFGWENALAIAGGAAVLAIVKAIAAAYVVQDAVSPASLVSADSPEGP